MRRVMFILGFLGLLGCPFIANAASVRFSYRHFLYTLNSADHPEWRTPAESWIYKGEPIDAPAAFRVDGDDIPPLPEGVVRRETLAWNTEAIKQTLQRTTKNLVRNPGHVVIKRGSGGIVFEGAGLTGRAVDLERAVDLTIAALEQRVTEIALPVIETQPELRVFDPQLVEMGIKEVVTIGESEFTGSPVNRRYNIGVGLRKFNGHLIPAHSLFSFNTILGRVDASTGYRKELVIKGDRTEPDYGGGLCQISTTAYRGIWEYGFPIVKRKNHSYTVRYYAPAGTDATVYPGSIDMVFKNDMPTALLIQTYQENNRAYFIYYGTRDERRTAFAGPFIYDRREPPPDRIEYTTEIPAGTTEKLNERVSGLKATWYRFVYKDGELSAEPESVFSTYEARPLFTAIGVEQLPGNINTPEPPRSF